MKAVLGRFPSVSQVFTLSEANGGDYPAPHQEEDFNPGMDEEDIPPESR